MQQHCDPDVLALAALDASELSAADRDHLAVCGQCTHDLSDYLGTVAVVRDAEDITLVQPPPSVWRAIETAMDDDASGSLGTSPPAPVAGRSQVGGATITSFPERQADGTPSVPSRWSRWLPVGVAAASGLVIGGLLMGAIGLDRDEQAPPPQIVAEAQLAALPDGPVDTVGSGTAKFEKDNDGNDILVVDTTGLEQPDGFYQVWLLNPKTSGLVSLGTVGSGAQQVTFPVPPGIDPDTFSVVDISDEPLDGDPNHSKVSVLRGELAV